MACCLLARMKSSTMSRAPDGTGRSTAMMSSKPIGLQLLQQLFMPVGFKLEHRRGVRPFSGCRDARIVNGRLQGEVGPGASCFDVLHRQIEWSALRSQEVELHQSGPPPRRPCQTLADARRVGTLGVVERAKSGEPAGTRSARRRRACRRCGSCPPACSARSNQFLHLVFLLVALLQLGEHLHGPRPW